MPGMSLTRNPDRDSLPAELLREYELVGEELLGEGAFAVVRLMRHIQSGELFALKCVEKHPLRIRNMICQMQREVKIQNSLVHPNILRLVRTFDEQTYVYMLLEYCGKGSLRSLLQQSPGNRLEDSIAAGYFEQIARGVEWMHRNSCVHRDLKLENMLLTDEDVVKICDFGWSADVSIEEMLQTTCGTTSYWAPEIWEGGLQDEAVDLWALGCMLYEMLAGHAPFYEQDQLKLKQKVLAVEFGYPPWLSNESCHAVHILLQRVPTQRAKAAAILRHPWLSKYKGSSQQVLGDGKMPLPPPEAEQILAKGDSAIGEWQRGIVAPTAQPPVLPSAPAVPGTPGPPRRFASSFVAAQRPQQLAEDGLPRSGSFVLPQTLASGVAALGGAATLAAAGKCDSMNVGATTLAAAGRCDSLHARPPVTPLRGPPRNIAESSAFQADVVGSIQLRMMQAPMAAPMRDPTLRQSFPRPMLAGDGVAAAGGATPSRNARCRYGSPARRAVTPGPRSASPLPRSATQAPIAPHGFADSTSVYPGFFQNDQVASTPVATVPLLPTRASMVVPAAPMGLVLPAPHPVPQPSAITPAPVGPAAVATLSAAPQSPLATTRTLSAAPGGTASLRPASPAALRAPSPGSYSKRACPPSVPASALPNLTQYHLGHPPFVGPPGSSVIVQPQQRCGTSFGLLAGLTVPDVQGIQIVPSIHPFCVPKPPLFA